MAKVQPLSLEAKLGADLDAALTDVEVADPLTTRRNAAEAFNRNRASMGFGTPALPGGTPAAARATSVEAPLPAAERTSTDPLLERAPDPLLMSPGEALLSHPSTYGAYADMTGIGPRMQRLGAVDSQQQAAPASTVDPAALQRVNELTNQLGQHVGQNGNLNYGTYAPQGGTAGGLMQQPWAGQLAEAQRLNSTLPVDQQVNLPTVQYHADKMGSSAPDLKTIAQGTRDRQAAIEAQRAADPKFQQWLANSQGYRRRDQLLDAGEEPLAAQFAAFSRGDTSGMPSMLAWRMNPEAAKLQAEAAVGAAADERRHQREVELAKLEQGSPLALAKLEESRSNADFNRAQGDAIRTVGAQKARLAELDPAAAAGVEDPQRRLELAAIEGSKGGNLSDAVNDYLTKLWQGSSMNAGGWLPNAFLRNKAENLKAFQQISQGYKIDPRSVEKWWRKHYTHLPADYTRPRTEDEIRDELLSDPLLRPQDVPASYGSATTIGTR